MYSKHTPLSTLATVAAFALSFPGAALAQSEDAAGTPVIVLPYAPLYGEMPQSTGDRATEFVTREIAETKGLRLVPLGEKKSDKAEADELDLAKREIDEAKALFDKAAQLAKSKPPKVKPAADNYEKGIQQFLLNFQGADDFKALSDAYVQLSVARFKLGNEEEAIKLLDDVIRVDPDCVLAAPEVANIFATLHAKSRKAFHAKERGQIKVLSTPAGARVTLDGKDLGETPLLARDVLPGEHYVRVVKAGQGAFWKKVKVVSGEQVELNADLSESATGPLAGIAKSLQDNTIDEKTMAAIRATGEASKAEFILFGGIHKDGDNIAVKTYALKVKEGTFAELAPLTFDVEMVGAAIEVFKLASDVSEKAREFTGVKLPGTMQLFPGAERPKVDSAVNEVRVTPGTGEGAAPVKGEEPKGGRRVVKAQTEEERRPAEVEKPADVETPADENVRIPKRIRERTKIGQEETKKAEEPKAEEPEISVKSDNKDALSLALDEEEAAAAEQKKKDAAAVDLNLRKKKNVDSSDLTPEELAKLNAAEQDGRKDKGNGGKILMYTGIGVGVAALLGGGAYFLLRDTAPTGAAVHINWQP